VFSTLPADASCSCIQCNADTALPRSRPTPPFPQLSPAALDLAVGSQVEVRAVGDGFRGGWFLARLLQVGRR
jgi:hypothetical protein